MKKLIIGLAVALSFTTAQAETKSTDAEICEAVSTLAESIMRSRQSGTSVVSVAKIVQDNKLAMMIVKEAYREPAYSSEPYRSQAVTDFGSKYYLQCLEARGKGKKR